ncbi:hypothetical protein PIB30_111638, partial [Stylosanthes scabra]|nr:hypothetical protein [Stylosanthes scabra]
MQSPCSSVFPSSIAELTERQSGSLAAQSRNVAGRTHPMITRARVGIFKPKVLTSHVAQPSLDLTQHKPLTVAQALASPHWKAAMDE